jgi:hypothetical protein
VRRNPDYREINLLRDANDVRLIAFRLTVLIIVECCSGRESSGHNYLDAFGSVYNVRIRHDVTFWIDDHSRPDGSPSADNRAGHASFAIVGRAVTRDLDLNDGWRNASNQPLDGIVQLMQDVGWTCAWRSLTSHSS